MINNFGTLGFEILGSDKWRSLSQKADDESFVLSLYVMENAIFDCSSNIDIIFISKDNEDGLKSAFENNTPVFVFESENVICSFIESLKTIWNKDNTQIVDFDFEDLKELFQSKKSNVEIIFECSDLNQEVYHNIMALFVNYSIKEYNALLADLGNDSNCIVSIVSTANIHQKDKRFYASYSLADSK